MGPPSFWWNWGRCLPSNWGIYWYVNGVLFRIILCAMMLLKRQKAMFQGGEHPLALLLILGADSFWLKCVCVWKWGLPPIYGMYFFGKMMINHDDILSSGQTIALNMKHGMCDLSPCSVGMPRYSIILSSWFKFWRCGECFCELSPKVVRTRTHRIHVWYIC